MTEPRIRYAKSSDGVSIAYWTIGTGPALVQLPLTPFSHIEMEWRLPALRAWYERLSQGSMLVRYDGRGNGLSERGVADHSLDAHVNDLATVVDQLETDQVALLGVLHSGPAAAAFAASAPERVSHLILWCAYADGPAYWGNQQAAGLRALRQTDYRMFLRTASHELFGWTEDAQVDAFAEVMRQAATPDEADQLIAATHYFDVRAQLQSVTCPVLVVHRRQMQWLDVGLSRALATELHDARLAIVDGSSPLPAVGDIGGAVGLIEEFLGRESSGAARELVGAGQMRVVVFTDLVGHSDMMSRLGDDKGRAITLAHEQITRAALAKFGGNEVKTLGDGFMSWFGSVTSAIHCAISLQREIEGLASRLGEPVSVRIGLSAGEPIEERNLDGHADLFGATVILAARVADAAAGGEIFVTDTVRGLCAGKTFRFHDRGEHAAKGFPDPVRLFEVSWREAG